MAITSYNGWIASRSASSIGVDPNFTAAGRKFPGGVKSGDVATVMRYLVEQLNKRVERVDLYSPGDEWGWYYKSSANASYLLSCHSSGTAIDFNATRHPNGRRGTFSATQVVAIRQILAECSGVIRWGGDFAGTKDEMHFEIIGSAAQVKAAAARITNNTPPQHQAPAPEDYFMDHHGVARMLFQIYLGRNPKDQTELDSHAWALAVHGLNARCDQLSQTDEARLYEHKRNIEIAVPDNKDPDQD